MDHDGTDHTKQGLGHYGETLAARHLTGAGMVLLDRNWRTQPARSTCCCARATCSSCAR